ncbi:uncharacterized protein [Leptinotarsa decemlineata]|uniref:uncharacterized protein n=1 Tax=Leptinotarsa decemlineata TaxID=7539 RepID=UPI003D30C39A
MPREASKSRGWEKIRRNRLNEAFASLAKVLPCYDPSVNLTKIEILTKATCAVKDLQDEVNKIITPNAENKSDTGSLVNKLQERIKKLIVRNEQLSNLLKDAKISIPKEVGNVKTFTGKLPWSKKISPAQAKLFQKNEMEKENISTKLVQVKKKKKKLVKANRVPKQSTSIVKKSEKMNSRKRKSTKGAVSSTARVFVLPQSVTVGGLNQQCYFITNPTTISSAKSKAITSGSQTSQISNATFPLINPIKPSLGPGILILANGTVIQVLSKSQVIVSEPSFISKPIRIPKPDGSNNRKSNEKIENSEMKKSLSIRPKPCITRTTQVNKVPIPALTSHYANNYYLLGETSEKKMCDGIANKNSPKTQVKVSGAKRKAMKRKGDAGFGSTAKKLKNNTNENVTDPEIETDVEKPNEKNPSEVLTTFVSEVPVSVNNIPDTTATTVAATITSSNVTSDTINVESTITSSNVTSDTINVESKISFNVAPIPLSEASNCVNNIQNNSKKLVSPELSLSITEVESVIQRDDGNDKKDDEKDTTDGTENKTREICPDNNDVGNKSISACGSSQISNACTISNVNNSVTVDVHEDTIKNLELNLEHSELSNDIFASLQVPTGCQNPESTSPTAAFLLAFPLVSSVKVTDVIDDDNSESQRETPTLLQIGTMDSTKTKHTETLASGLLALDSFSFFNGKDVYGNFCNSYPSETKKGDETAAEKTDTSNKPNDISSLQISDQFTVDEIVHTLPSNVPEVIDNSKLHESCSKQSNSIDEKERDEFRKAESMNNSFNEILVENPVKTCSEIPNSSEEDENACHDISEKNGKHEKQSCEKQHFKESDTLCQEKPERKLPSIDNPCSEGLIVRKNETCQYDIYSKSHEETVKREHINVSNNNGNAKVFSGSKFDDKVKEGYHDNSLSGIKNARCVVNQIENKKLPKVPTEHFSSTLKDVHVPKSQNICYNTVPNQNISANVLKTSEGDCKNITKNMLNDISFICDSKPDLSRKIVPDIVLRDFENIHNNLKENKNLDFNTVNMNPMNISSTLIDKGGGSHYSSYQSKSSNKIEMISSNSIKNCNENISNARLSENTHFSLFESPPKDITSTLNNFSDKISNIRSVDLNIHPKTVVDHLQHQKKPEDTSLKTSAQKPQSYFSASYADASCSFNYRSNPAKMCPTCSYMNLNKNYPNPLYTNCTNHNYNYPETNFNQSYYKPVISRSETKSHHPLNYENYQEHRKIDYTSKYYGNTTNYLKDKRTNNDKEKCLVQNKPVNWMTTPDNRVQQPPEPFLPTFSNQSYSFASCNTGETGDASSIEPKKTDIVPLAPEDKQFSWSPTKLPNFLDTAASFVTPTLPTLVGDLALGNPLTFGDQKPECKYPKEPKRKIAAYENPGNFLSVSQLVDHNKVENVPSRIATRRNSGNRAKNIIPAKHKKSPKNDQDKASHLKPTPNNYNMLGTNEIFYEQKVRNLPKSMPSSYSAEALIGNQVPEVPKKYSSGTIKPVGSSNFLTENIINYFPAVDDGYLSQNQNMLHSFQNNTYNTNTFVYAAPTISSTHVTSNFDSIGHEYAHDNFLHVPNTVVKDSKICPNKNYRQSTKDEKNVTYTNNVKKSRKKQTDETNNGGFDYPLLSMHGSTNSPILPDDFHSHSNFLPPTTPYTSKNSFYQRQGNEFNSAAVLPLTGLHRNNMQHSEPPSMNVAGTSLTNFNLSTIFPEINKGTISNMYSDNRSKEHSTSQQVPFNIDPKYTFPV